MHCNSMQHNLMQYVMGRKTSPPYLTTVTVLFLWYHWAHSDYFESQILLKPVLCVGVGGGRGGE